MIRAIRGTIGNSLLAANTAASIVVQTSPTVLIADTLLDDDSQFNSTNGVITIIENCMLSISIYCNFVTSGSQKTIYIDGEFFIDGQWVRSVHTCRAKQIKTGDGLQSSSFSFPGYLAAGTIVRVMVWASEPGVTMQTVTNQGSTSPAISVSYTTIACKVR